MPTPRARRLLLPLVFVSGMSSLGVEFGSSRLLAPYFGTSLYLWGVLLGLILIYLAAGYVIGWRPTNTAPRPPVPSHSTSLPPSFAPYLPLRPLPPPLAPR